MTADELRALADYVDGLDYVAADPQACKDAAAIIRTIADLQEPARKALESWQSAIDTSFVLRTSLRPIMNPLSPARALAAIVERIVEVGE